MPIQDVNAQTNRNHAVPQNIMDVEFKIIGDLTMRQFSYLLVLGLLSYINVQVMVGIFKWPLTVFFVLLGLGLAFVPVQDRGMDVWLVNFIKSVYNPTQLVWRKSVGIPTAFLYDSINVVKQELITLAPTSSRRKLEEYLDYSRSNLPKDPLDMKEDEYILKVRSAYEGVPQVEAVAPTPLEPSTKALPTPVSRVITEEIPAEVKFEKTEQAASIATITPLEKVEPTAVKPEEKRISMPTAVSEIIQKAGTALPKVAPIIKTTVGKEESIFKKIRMPISMPTSVFVPTAQITPDRHTGRRFTSFLPAQGELVLPIRGERVLKTIEQKEIEEDLEVKTEKLQKLISQIRQSNIKPAKKVTEFEVAGALPTETKVPEIKLTSEEKTPIVANVPTQIVTAEITNVSMENKLNVLKSAFEKLSTHRQDLMNEINKLKTSNAIKYADRINDLQKDLQKINEDYEEMKKQIEELEKTVIPVFKAPDNVVSAPVHVKAADIPSLGKTNVLWGFVKDPLGKPLSDVVVIVKNVRGEPVRATKTNPLGQFLLSTPMINGKYTLEISATNKTGYSFDVLSVEVSGNIIPPVEFIGK